MRYSVGIVGDGHLAELTRLAAAPLGVDLLVTAHGADVATRVVDVPWPGGAGLAVTVVRAGQGQLVVYSPTEVHPTPGGVETLTPASSVDAELGGKLQERAIAATVEQGVVGALTVAFDTDGRRRATQLGPDVAALWTIDAAHTSAFHNHVRALLNLPLGSPAPLAQHAVAVTAVPGREEDPTGSLQHICARDREVRIHLTGGEGRQGEWLGHVTCFGHDVEDLRRRAQHAASYLMGVDDRTDPQTG